MGALSVISLFPQVCVFRVLGGNEGSREGVSYSWLSLLEGNRTADRGLRNWVSLGTT